MRVMLQKTRAGLVLSLWWHYQSSDFPCRLRSLAFLSIWPAAWDQMSVFLRVSVRTVWPTKTISRCPMDSSFLRVSVTVLRSNYCRWSVQFWVSWTWKFVLGIQGLELSLQWGTKEIVEMNVYWIFQKNLAENQSALKQLVFTGEFYNARESFVCSLSLQ